MSKLGQDWRKKAYGVEESADDHLKVTGEVYRRNGLMFILPPKLRVWVVGFQRPLMITSQKKVHIPGDVVFSGLGGCFSSLYFTKDRAGICKLQFSK